MLLIGGAAVLLVAAGRVGLRAWVGEAGEWSTVERGDLVLGVEVTGALQAVKTNLLGPPQLRNMWNFKIAHMASEGEGVAAGATVLAFDTSELDQRLQREIAERDAARKQVEKAEQELSLRQQQDALRLAEARARLGKSELKAARPDELEAARELALVGLELELTQKEVAYLDSRIEASARSAEATLGALRDQLLRAERDVEQTRNDIERMRVTAASDGTVIYVQDWNDQKKKVGDACWRGESVIELPDLARMKALGLVHEADAGRVAEGQRVTLRLDAHPELEFAGRVASIWRTVQRETHDSPKKVVRLEIELAETDRLRMRPGMRFRGKIEVERVAGALLVDAGAVVQGPQGPLVFLRTPLGQRATAVELGRHSEGRVEVLGGLSEGDSVALADPDARRRAQA